MAPLSNYTSFLFLITLLFPLQIITARDSQFFSKVTSNFNKNKETELLGNKEGPPVTNKPEQQQPAFIPETENSYGLYGHDSHDHLPSTNTPINYPTYTTPTSATYQPHKSPEFEEDTTKYFNNNDDHVFSTNKDAFGNDQLSDTKYTQEEYNSMGNQNNNNNHQKNHFNNNAAAATKRYNNYHNSRYNGEKQGMSDTRFLEGGRYFHDIYNDQKYNPTLYGDSSTEMNTNNKYWYNNRGNNNNNNNYAYQNYGGNNNNAYQNQEEFEDEQEEFEP